MISRNREIISRNLCTPDDTVDYFDAEEDVQAFARQHYG
jgi:predicted RNA-binding Zn ribbon-like protein